MIQQVKEQLSAFMDDELSVEQSDLLLLRLREDAELRAAYESYGLIGESIRGGVAVASCDLASRVRDAVAEEAPLPAQVGVATRFAGALRPAAMVAVAAGVAVVALVGLRGLQERPVPDAPVVAGVSQPQPVAVDGKVARFRLAL